LCIAGIYVAIIKEEDDQKYLLYTTIEFAIRMKSYTSNK